MTVAVERLPIMLSGEQRAALAMFTPEYRVLPACFTPNDLCFQLVALGLLSWSYNAGRTSIALTRAGAEALRMIQ